MYLLPTGLISECKYILYYILCAGVASVPLTLPQVRSLSIYIYDHRLVLVFCF